MPKTESTYRTTAPLDAQRGAEAIQSESEEKQTKKKMN